jgi:hypothetical protein
MLEQKQQKTPQKVGTVRLENQGNPLEVAHVMVLPGDPHELTRRAQCISEQGLAGV